MKILVFWDIYGRIGRKAFTKEIANLKEEHTPDFVIANVDNITSGRWAVSHLVDELCDLGVDLCTGWDHIFDNYDKVSESLDAEDSHIIRPGNFFESKYYKLAWKGYKILEKNGQKLLVIHVVSGTFLRDTVQNPYLYVDELLDELCAEDFDAIILDYHKEASAEVWSMAFFLDGRVSAVFGTHTHLQTNDELILDKGTGVIWDVWMSGSLYSVIGAEFWSIRKRTLTGIMKWKIKQSLDKRYVVNACLFDVCDKTGETKNILKIRQRGELS